MVMMMMMTTMIPIFFGFREGLLVLIVWKKAWWCPRGNSQRNYSQFFPLRINDWKTILSLWDGSFSEAVLVYGRVQMMLISKRDPWRNYDFKTTVTWQNKNSTRCSWQLPFFHRFHFIWIWVCPSKCPTTYGKFERFQVLLLVDQKSSRLTSSHDLQGFIHPKDGCLGFLNHQLVWSSSGSQKLEEDDSIIVDLKHATCWWLTLTFVLINLLPPLQIRLPKGKDRIPTMNFQWLCLVQGVHYRFFGDCIEEVVKDQNSKPWLAKRKVLQVPHLAKLLANNNSVKVWIILDLTKKSFRYCNSFCNNHGSGSKDHFED